MRLTFMPREASRCRPRQGYRVNALIPVAVLRAATGYPQAISVVPRSRTRPRKSLTDALGNIAYHRSNTFMRRGDSVAGDNQRRLIARGFKMPSRPLTATADHSQEV